MLNNIPADFSMHFDILDQGGEVGMENVNASSFNRLEVPIKLTPETSTFDDVAIHALIRQRLSLGTINRRLRYARFMERYEPKDFAVNFKNPSAENFIRHLDYREQIEGAGHGALKHEYQAYRMFWEAWGKNPSDVPYKPPRNPKYTIIPIAFPEQIYNILHTKYSNDYYEDSNIKHILAKNHIMGWRFPSEASILKLDDVDLDNNTILITSPKLNNATRLLDISELENKRSAYNFRNYIDKIRPKFENQYSKDYLFIHPSGKPFEKPDQLRMYVNRKANKEIKSIFPRYYNYTSRHWCAVARLIRTKIETKHFDVYEVKEWMGHTKIQTTMTYLQHAKFYYKKMPFDWIKRVLKFHKKVGEQNTLKNPTRPKMGVGHEFNRSGTERRLPTAICSNRYKLKPENSVFGGLDISIYPFSSFSFVGVGA